LLPETQKDLITTTCPKKRHNPYEVKMNRRDFLKTPIYLNQAHATNTLKLISGINPAALPLKDIVQKSSKPSNNLSDHSMR
jgi:hypothetical protein